MTVSRLGIFVLLAVILGVPFAMRPRAAPRVGGADVPTLVVVTPHVPQIQNEFSKGFDRWHRREFGTPVAIDWRQPGGTSEIIKVLEAHYQAAASAFDFSDPKNPTCPAGACAYDIMFGGGSFDHGRLKTGTRVSVGGADQSIPMSEPAGFEQAQLDEWFGENTIGAGRLYDPDQFWLGTAVSGFGIVYNRDVLRELGLPEPASFRDLARPELRGRLTFADPRQSGSAATSLDAILSREGWDAGWRLLREMCANARTFTNSSPKPPIDVSQGDSAAGLAIDFYGRGQAQAVTPPGVPPSESRVGYVDPPGETYIDADPVSILRGGPNPELSRRFVRFCLSDEGQALWQFHATGTPAGASNPRGPGGEPMGPEVNELRRMPVRRAMYQRYANAFVDRGVNPFEIASTAKPAGWRSAIPIMMGAFAIDNAGPLREAWAALLAARANPATDATRLAAMEAAFYAFPTTPGPDGAPLAFTPENYKAISTVWRDRAARARCEIAYTRFFRARYQEVVALGTGQAASPRAGGPQAVHTPILTGVEPGAGAGR
ncbi:MAG: extracellular solute-binding protein [Planctomycetota bacterium]|nr:extracellular solute-binding protein [Planctomycetota bacterium]